MAYPTVNAPYGLIPINLIGGQVFAGANRHLPIASGYSTAIFYGDIVKFKQVRLLFPQMVVLVCFLAVLTPILRLVRSCSLNRTHRAA
jgi:hypothetical protein